SARAPVGRIPPCSRCCAARGSHRRPPIWVGEQRTHRDSGGASAVEVPADLNRLPALSAGGRPLGQSLAKLVEVSPEHEKLTSVAAVELQELVRLELVQRPRGQTGLGR